MKGITVAIVLATLAFQSVFAQGYQPRDTWPYEKEKFEEGAVRTRNGALIRNAEFNISIIDGSLHYIDDSKVIMKSEMPSVYTAQVGKDVYFNVSGRMMKILSEIKEGLILRATYLDREKMQKTDIGYGASSSTASTHNAYLTNELDNTLVNLSYQVAFDQRLSGQTIPYFERTYLFSNGYLVQPTRQGMIEAGLDKSEVNKFFKEHKVKVKDLASLEEALLFLYSQIKNQ